MNRYLIFHKPSISCPYNAWDKAPADIRFILKSAGFEEFSDDYLSTNRFLRFFKVPAMALRMASHIRKDSLIFFQHPYDTSHKALAMMNRIMLGLCRNVKTAVIVHDLESNQVGEISLADEAAFLNRFDLVIVHSPQMKKVLTNAGLTSECRVLGLFDYIVNCQNKMERRKDGGICFAGNFRKSSFLQHLPEIKDAHFLLYGSECGTLPLNESIQYKGRFSPDDLSSIEGGWGLVWDGDSLEACHGRLGEYLRLNSPHKASMYLCAGFPLIVPEGSAVADIVRQYKIGLVLPSLTGLSEAIAAVSDEEYGSMLANVHKCASALMNGENIKKALSI